MSNYALEINYIIERINYSLITRSWYLFVLDQHAESDCYSTNSLKQHSIGRHAILLGHPDYEQTSWYQQDKTNKQYMSVKYIN